jgi:hypothetical protein
MEKVPKRLMRASCKDIDLLYLYSIPISEIDGKVTKKTKRMRHGSNIWNTYVSNKQNTMQSTEKGNKVVSVSLFTIQATYGL